MPLHTHKHTHTKAPEQGGDCRTDPGIAWGGDPPKTFASTCAATFSGQVFKLSNETCRAKNLVEPKKMLRLYKEKSNTEVGKIKTQIVGGDRLNL